MRTRAQRDTDRLAAGIGPAKDLENMQHELTSLARRQSTLEDDALELAVRHLSQIGVEVAGVHRLDPVHRWRDSQDHRIVGWEDWAAGAGSDVTLDQRPAT